MAVAFRNKTISAFATAANITAVEPTSAAADDIEIAFLYIESDTAVTAPASWSNSFNGTAMLSECNTASSPFRLYAYWVRRTGSAPALGWTFASSGRMIYVAAYSGALASGDPFSFGNHQVRDTTASRTYPDCSGTTTDANEMLIWAGGTFANPTSSTQPTGYTERQDTGTLGLCSADLIQAGAGAASSTGASYAGGSTETSAAQLVGLRPAAAGGATTRGMPFETRSTAFNGGRTFRGPLHSPVAQMWREIDALARRNGMLRRAA
jgi:hypothetical protein